jgi:uncharacterized protein YdhG (YjbR/CyaY superfamily)
VQSVSGSSFGHSHVNPLISQYLPWWAIGECIAALPQPYGAIGERFHALIKANAPALSPKTWYGMPAYAKEGNVVCFFQSAQKFKTRYTTLGFSDKANLDEGHVWPTAFAIKELTGAKRQRSARS